MLIQMLKTHQSEGNPTLLIYVYIITCAHYQRTLCQVRVYWVGVYSRWGSIISLPAIDWGCIRNLYGWGCNQEWGQLPNFEDAQSLRSL